MKKDQVNTLKVRGVDPETGEENVEIVKACDNCTKVFNEIFQGDRDME